MPTPMGPKRSAGDAVVGRPVDRVDGSLKVTGGARYSAEMPADRMAYAVPVGATIASGTIQRIDSADALKAPGVLAVITYENMPPLKPVTGGPTASSGEERAAARRLPLHDATVYYSGQYVAVVVGDTLERARRGAELLKITYAPTPHAVELERERAKAAPPKGKVAGKPADTERGAAAKALAAAPVRVDQTYRTPNENHHPMEPHATTAVWEGDKLTVFDATQFTYGVRQSLGKMLSIPEENVHVVSKFVGGGFGSKGTTWAHVVLAAVAARQVGRPVKLAVPRDLMFENVGHRSETEQRVALGAGRDGKLLAIVHEGLSHTSTFDEFVEPFTKATHMMYACPNLRASQRIVELNVGTPTYMRAPGETTGMFALECALDELAHELKMDPVQLRVLNHADTDPESGLPWSSKSLLEAYRAAGERFGWSRRSAKPRATRDGRWLVGVGMASAVYPVNHFPGSARVRILADGTAVAESSTHELGTGTYTILTQIAAEELGLPPERVTANIGDTYLPKAFVSGGSSTAMAVGSAVQGAARDAVAKLAEMARADAKSPLHVAPAERIVARGGRLVFSDDASKGESFEDILRRAGVKELAGTFDQQFDDRKKEFSSHSFGAHFVEVRVDEDFGEVRVSRYVGAFGVGRALNRKTVSSQLSGGVVMGIGMALMEDTILDPNIGRIVNRDLAEYHMPVNADVPMLDIIVVDEVDPHASPVGAKGAGEIGIVGAAAAVANAVFNATGVRVRDLPITPDKVFMGVTG